MVRFSSSSSILAFGFLIIRPESLFTRTGIPTLEAPVRGDIPCHRGVSGEAISTASYPVTRRARPLQKLGAGARVGDLVPTRLPGHTSKTRSLAARRRAVLAQRPLILIIRQISFPNVAGFHPILSLLPVDGQIAPPHQHTGEVIVTIILAKALRNLAILSFGCPFVLTPQLTAAPPANPKHWMADISDQIAKVPLKGIAIPGSHDSAMWDPTYGPDATLPSLPFPISLIQTYEVSQSGDFAFQLANGVRWFDMRPTVLTNQTCSNIEPFYADMFLHPHTGIYMSGHGGDCTDELFTQVLNEIATFVQANPKEIVILSLDIANSVSWNAQFEQAAQSTLVDQHGNSLVYDHNLACTLSGNDYTAPASCDGPTLYPQNVTPEMLWQTPARVIIVDPNDDLSCTQATPGCYVSNLAWGVIKTTPPIGPDIPQDVEYIEGWNGQTSGTANGNMLLSFLDFGDAGTPNPPGLFFERPKYASYPSAPTLFVSQAALTPFASGAYQYLDYKVNAFGDGWNSLENDAKNFNPVLAGILKNNQTPPTLPPSGDFQDTYYSQEGNWGWFPYAVNVVEMDFPDLGGGAQAVIAFNNEQWGEISGNQANEASAVAAGPTGSVYKLDNAGVSGTDPILYQWYPANSAWAPVSTGTEVPATGVRVAVDQHGNPWVVSSTGVISRQVGPGQWAVVGALLASDIAIGYNGQAWAIGKDQGLYEYNAVLGQWTLFEFTSPVPFHIAVDASGNLLVVNTSGSILYYKNGSTKPTLISAPFAATSIGFGGGKIWATGVDSQNFTGVWSLRSPATWTRHRNSGSGLAVDSLGQPWLLRAGNLMIGKLR